MSVRVSVVVPARDAAAVLPRSLAALREASHDAGGIEVIVVIDGIDAATAAAASPLATRIIQLPDAHGPGNARNAGASVALGDFLVFVDADVVVHHDALARLVAALDGDETLAAVFGAYDGSPTAPSMVSQYVNLVHHFVHRRHAGRAVTFWAGLGAIRRSAFDTVGGFDGDRFGRAQIEDVELGYRLTDAGFRIVTDPAIQGTHLKRWTLAGFFVSGIRDRAVPWIQLILERRRAGLSSGAMDVNRREGLLTVTVVAGFALLATGLVSASGYVTTIGTILLAAVTVANLPLFIFLAHRRGATFAIGAVPLRLASYLINAVGTAAGLARWTLIRPP